jgi:hypothetical protein
MKKISSGRNLVHHIFTKKINLLILVLAIGAMRDVNQLLEKHNLTIRFKNSNHWTDDLHEKK